jgi:hypothetical protein
MNEQLSLVPMRRTMDLLLILIAAAMAAGHILGLARAYEPYLYPSEASGDSSQIHWPARRPNPLPTLGANDRSRWVTVRSLVESGTYVIGRRDTTELRGKESYVDRGLVFEPGWESIDKVLRRDTNEFYSSKPPLLPTLVAGEYWVMRHLFDWSITDPRGQVIRTVLLTVNWVPLVVYLVLLSRLVKRFGTTDWGRVYVLAAGCFATFLTPFVVTLNNHSVATCACLFSLYSVVKIWSAEPARGKDGKPMKAPSSVRDDRMALHFLSAGFFAGFTATNELPAASFAVLLLIALILRKPGPALLLSLPAAALPVAAFLVTNYLALGRLTPAYSEVHGPWYQYEGSFWDASRGPRHGIDWANESKAVYGFHFLLGHHGLFSLTPVFFLGLVGMVVGLRRLVGTKRGESWQGVVNSSDPETRKEQGELASDCCLSFPLIAVIGLVVTIVTVGFYIIQTNNYGGWTAGPRWLLWLTPLLLLAMVPVADQLARGRWGRVLGYVLLAMSIFSVSYPAWNPWRHPWIYDLGQTLGWIGY